MPNLLEQVKRTINQYMMLPPGANRVLIAVSGGPDSIVLADILVRIAEEAGLFLCLAHLDHMFRGAESAEDARFVREWAQARDLPAIIEARDVSRLRSRGESKQEAARRIRYEFLAEASRRFGGDRIALAHTMTDQAETVLMRLMSGGGSAGISGIPPVRDQLFIRPLLWTAREEILSYANLRGLDFRLDPSNDQLVYLRNKIRLELVPFIRERFNPGIEEALARVAEIFRAEDEYLADEVDKWLEDNVQWFSEEAALNLKVLSNQPLALQRRAVREVYTRLVDKHLSFDHVSAILDLTQKSGGNFDLDLPGAKAQKLYDTLKISTQIRDLDLEEVVIAELAIPGTTSLPTLGVEIYTALHNGGAELLASLQAKGIPNKHAFFDLDKVCLPLQVRTRREGDVFIPFGMTGHKKIKDYLIDEKILPDRRDRIPIVLDQQGVLWLAGLRQSGRAAITEDTKRILEVEIGNVASNSPV